MANLRVVYDNAASSTYGCVVTATSTAGTLVPANLLTDLKSEIWRGTSTTQTITLTWPTAQAIHMVALPFASLTPTATIRVRGNATPGGTQLFDSGVVTPAGLAASFYSQTHTANQYGFGAGVCPAVWFTGANVREVTILITDTSNANGYIEAAKVVAGNYWSPVNQCEVGVEVNMADLSKHERDDGGGLRTDRGARYKTLSFDLSFMPAADRNTFWKIMLNNGMTKSVFVSLDPTNASDVEGESLYQIYGRLSKTASLKYLLPTQFNSRMDIEEV